MPGTVEFACRSLIGGAFGVDAGNANEVPEQIGRRVWKGHEIQSILALKNKNAKKLDSHPGFDYAFDMKCVPSP